MRITPQIKEMPINIRFLLGALIATPNKRITPRAAPIAPARFSPLERSPSAGTRTTTKRNARGCIVSMANHPKYRTIEGREYVLVSHAREQMLGMTNDSLEAAADFASKWFKSGDDGLAAAIRSLKQD